MLLVAGITVTFGNEYGPALIVLGLGASIVFGLTEISKARRRREFAALLSSSIANWFALRTALFQEDSSSNLALRKKDLDVRITGDQAMLRKYAPHLLPEYNVPPPPTMGTYPGSIERNNVIKAIDFKIILFREFLSRRGVP